MGSVGVDVTRTFIDESGLMLGGEGFSIDAKAFTNACEG